MGQIKMFRYQPEIYTRLEWHKHSLSNLEKMAKVIDLTKISSHHDLACGTGDFVNEMSRLGIKSSGTDISPEMIRVARTRFPGLSFSLKDMTEVILKPKVDLVTINYFSINMLKSTQSFTKLFKSICESLNQHGTFVFDFASAGFINNASIQSFQVKNGVYLLEDIHTIGNSCVFNLIWFTKEGSSYRKTAENYSEITLPIRLLVKRLKRSGFRSVNVRPLDDSEDINALDKVTGGLLVIAKK